ncbi:hypothetical protein BDZ85DRAFT_256729 [Elsinoe ampelina]|uniref:Uncharacterized protein n=1 Tax=Elsinoe ampelina TaxID=302913 RepID=A0A6A6GMF8_9PEZI|nr:hypothetical protein BDZ85DRAFT_256729 [Elsinoe ampelina]
MWTWARGSCRSSLWASPRLPAAFRDKRSQSAGVDADRRLFGGQFVAGAASDVMDWMSNFFAVNYCSVAFGDCRAKLIRSG